MMATSDDMRERLKRVEAKVDRLDTKVDAIDRRLHGIETRVERFATKDDLARFATKDDLVGFATKDDLVGFATKADLVQFKEEILDGFAVLTEDIRDNLRKAAEGFGMTLERIERDLVDMNTKFGDRISDHDKILANHNHRITTIGASHAR